MLLGISVLLHVEEGEGSSIRESPSEWLGPRLREYGSGKIFFIKVFGSVDELPELSDIIPEDVDLIYHADAADYITTYDQFDMVVTTRVHGAGLAAALGIPAFVVAHSHRSQTAEGFLAELIDTKQNTVNDVSDLIDNFDSAARSKIIVTHQSVMKDRYLDLLRPALMPVRRNNAPS